MSKQQPQSGLMPRLRFPEFREAGEWKTRQLGQLGDVLMCKRIFADQTNDQGGVPFFKIGTLGGRPDAFIRNELFEEYKSKYNYPRKGEILITCSGTVGKCLSFDGENAYFQDSNIVWIDNPTLEISNEMLLSLLLTIDWGRLNSTTITRIYGSDLRNLSLTFPATPDEQQKIADCLSFLDALIAAQADKLDALKTHKKGLMQQLFPREGETIPRLRFPEFRGAWEWEVRQLGKIADVRDGTHDSPKFVTEGRPLVTSKNLLSDGSLDLQNVSLISEYDYEQINKRSKVDVGDILLGMIGTIGNPVLVKSDGYAIKNVALIKEKGELLNSYLVHLLGSQYIAEKFYTLNTGNTQKFIALGKIREIDVPVPKKIEQQKIADCFSSLDALIAAQADKLDALKTHKKGLMQQLFPSPEA